MKTYSTEKLPESPVKWWKDQFVIFINQKDNGVQPEEMAGMRYEAEMIVIDGNTETAIIEATNRNLHDTELDYAICANFEIEGIEAIKVKREYSPNLPEIRKVDIIFDHTIIKLPDEIKVLSGDADTNIRKLSGNIKNYVADLRDGKRTNATDKEVDILIADNNVLITNQ